MFHANGYKHKLVYDIHHLDHNVLKSVNIDADLYGTT